MTEYRSPKITQAEGSLWWGGPHRLALRGRHSPAWDPGSKGFQCWLCHGVTLPTDFPGWLSGNLSENRKKFNRGLSPFCIFKMSVLSLSQTWGPERGREFLKVTQKFKVRAGAQVWGLLAGCATLSHRAVSPSRQYKHDIFLFKEINKTAHLVPPPKVSTCVCSTPYPKGANHDLFFRSFLYIGTIHLTNTVHAWT